MQTSTEKTVLLCGCLLQRMVQAAAVDMSMLIIGRIFLGIGIGLANQVNSLSTISHPCSVILSQHFTVRMQSCRHVLLTRALVKVYCPVQVAPMYISETAPPSARGGLNIMFQLCTTIGILVASGINYGEHPALARLSQAPCMYLRPDLLAQ